MAEAKRSAAATGGVPRYVQLGTLFRRRIASGQWPTNDQIPTVDELAQEYSVARATIRQALGLLEAEGLISRFRAKGTFVNAMPRHELWATVETDWSGLLRSRENATIEILSSQVVAAPTSIPHKIGGPAPLYRHLRRRHCRDGLYFLLADVFLDERLAQKLTEEDFRTKTALRLAASIAEVQIIDARQTLTMGSADFETAELLGIPLNDPVAYVNRSAVDQHGQLILIAQGIYRGDLVRLDLKLK